MNDKELADNVVALGAGRKTEIMAGGHGNEHPETIYILDNGTLNAKDAEQFVCYWPLAGALMERVYEKRYSFMVMQMPVMTIQAPITTGEEYGDPSKRQSWASQVVAEPLPRAIIEACVKALATDQTGQ